MSNWPWLESFPLANGVRIVEAPSAFEAIYAEARNKERRVLTDEQVARLPDGQGLWNVAEWRIRSKSATRLLRSLNAQGRALRVLEVGCGNGWLSGRMAAAGHRVLGIDPFTEELEQAARLFLSATFARADLHSRALPIGSFDAIIFAASIQYFDSPHLAVKRALELLAPKGSIHILDSILYPSEGTAAAAQERTRNYYARLGVPTLAAHYHAHPLGDFMPYGAELISAPRSRFMQLISGDASPFAHLVIRKRG
ncbi:MAG TPA: methyltransferase domain-containing protein [Flavobacteriales bacterium]|nr:methyltransferase domain-containing protein [Flavobacteriales bacterium]